jgi:hypothetical protein
MVAGKMRHDSKVCETERSEMKMWEKKMLAVARTEYSFPPFSFLIQISVL